MTEKLTKETLDSWYTPRSEGLTEDEEKVTMCKLDMCDGTGELTTYSYDPDSHQLIPDGTRVCPCRLGEPDEE